MTLHSTSVSRWVFILSLITSNKIGGISLHVSVTNSVCVCLRDRRQLIAWQDIVPARGKLIGLFVRMLHLSFIDGPWAVNNFFAKMFSAFLLHSPLTHTHTHTGVLILARCLSFIWARSLRATILVRVRGCVVECGKPSVSVFIAHHCWAHRNLCNWIWPLSLAASGDKWLGRRHRSWSPCSPHLKLFESWRD